MIGDAECCEKCFVFFVATQSFIVKSLQSEVWLRVNDGMFIESRDIALQA